MLRPMSKHPRGAERQFRTPSLFLFLSILTALAFGCGDDDNPAMDEGTDATTPTDGGADTSTEDTGVEDSGTADAGPSCTLPDAPMRTCMAADTDYTPGADDMWPACISDDGMYNRVQESISSIQRVAAFEEIVTLLQDPTAENYLMARMKYQEEEGLDSRVARRYDPRVDAPDGTDCTQDGVPEMHPEYCVGPAILQPLILEAFSDGMTSGGDVPAARVEAALLRFFYHSVFKEAVTCTTKAKDCDSSYAYYTGGEAARGGIGLARVVAAADADAHDDVWDGLLGLRCWRDLDDAETATDLATRDNAIGQIDRALSDGVATVLRARLADFCAGGSEADWAYITTLGPALMTTAEARDAGQAATLATELGRDFADADAAALTTALDALFPCP